LSSEASIAYIDVRVFAHATEDLDKVLTAVRNLLPAGVLDIVIFNKTNLTGYYGNPITLFETKIKDQNIARQVFEKLSTGLGLMDKEFLNEEIKQHIERGNLYLRLDKQSAFLNQLKLSRTDPIHLRIHFKKHRPDEIIGVCRKSGLLV
jgi:RNA binding exosome subunit